MTEITDRTIVELVLKDVDKFISNFRKATTTQRNFDRESKKSKKTQEQLDDVIGKVTRETKRSEGAFRKLAKTTKGILIGALKKLHGAFSGIVNFIKGGLQYAFGYL